MRSILVRLVIWLALGLASSSSMAAGQPGSDTTLMQAFRTSEVAEIYIVRRDLTTPAGLRPYSIRDFGCRYFVHRSMAEWAELEQAVGSVRIEPASVSGELRIGLLFGNRSGAVMEVYSSELPMPDGRVKAYVNGREMAISASFPQALRRLAESHRDLARVDQSRAYLCAEDEPR